MKLFTILIAATLLTCNARAQFNIKDVSHGDSTKHKHTISIGNGGIRYDNGKARKNHTVQVQIGMLDLGINTLSDKTNYNSAATQQFLHVDNLYKNEDLFTLRTNKSINVNIYPVLLKVHLHTTEIQHWKLATGLGLQFYNFRFNKSVTFSNNPTPAVTLDTGSFEKNKLALDYLMLPLMLNGQSRIAAGNSDTTGGKKAKNGTWLTYGIGVSGGFLLSSWTKQISDPRGKEKNHDPFNLSKTNFCINGELGIDGYVRLYASYQITNMYKDNLDQHPLCIGIRFLGL